MVFRFTVTNNRESVELGTRTRRITAKELVDSRSEVFMHAAGRMNIVSPHRPVPLTDVPFPESILGRRFEDEIEKIPRG